VVRRDLNFVNVDTTSIQGIERAKQLGLVESGLADLIVTPFIYEAEVLFTPNARGRLFTIVRHPIFRAVSVFSHLQTADWEPTYNPEIANWSLEQYAQSDLVQNNWMVRQLTHTYDRDVTQEHANIAMDIFRRKFLVGIHEQMEETLDRVEKFFGLKYRVMPDNQEQCRDKLFSESRSKSRKEGPFISESAFSLLEAQTSFDMQVYNYVLSLFKEQGSFVVGIPDDYRKIDATCSECNPPTFPSDIQGGDSAPTSSGEVVPAAEMPPMTGSVLDTPLPPGEPLPFPNLDGFKDNTDLYEESDSPVFWHIPKAGGSTVKDIMGTCHRFTMASEAGVAEGHDQDTEIRVVRPGGVPADQDPSPFVNVDTTTVAGIKRAGQLGLAESGLADSIVTGFIFDADSMFSPNARGRLFTVFRHPVDRAVSLFFYLQVADWEPTYNPELANWSIENYARSPMIENNWMVRQLTNAYEGDLNEEHLKLAIEVVRRKILVGLLHEKQRTMDRVEKFFRFKYRINPPNQEICRENLLTGGANSNAGNKKQKPKQGEEAWELIAWQNLLDIKLYEFILTLFEEQEVLVADVPDDYRNMDATCAKCVPPSFPELTKLI